MDMKAKSAQLWDALRKSETTGAFTIFPNATGEIEQALTEAHDAGLAEEQAWGKNYRDNIVRLERERSALTAELAAAQEELESIQPDTDEHRTIADSIAGHRKWASATEKCERMCLEKAEKAEAEVIRQRGVNAALVIEKQKREAAEKERDRFQNQLGEKFPTSFGKLDWACGHTGPAACLQCFEGKCASADTLARELAAKNERLEYLEGQDRSLLEQHQASMITLGDSDLLAVSGRLLDRAEKAEAERDALKAAVKVKDEALQDAMGVLDELPGHWTVENLERVYDVCKRALSPEPEKLEPWCREHDCAQAECMNWAHTGPLPAPDGEGRKMRPKVICLCGSTRFFQQFMDENYRLTMEGNIVLSVGFFGHASAQAHGQTVGISPEQKVALDELHKRKIDLADEVFVVNPGGYIGESTRGEIIYAEAHGKPVRYLAALGGGDEGRKEKS
jgi:hypothetical protein